MRTWKLRKNDIKIYMNAKFLVLYPRFWRNIVHFSQKKISSKLHESFHFDEHLLETLGISHKMIWLCCVFHPCLETRERRANFVFEAAREVFGVRLEEKPQHLGVGGTATRTNRTIMRVVTRLTLEKMRLDWSRWCITVHFCASPLLPR